MARKTDVNNILFPVALHPVYTEIPEGDKKKKVVIPTSQVVINMATGHALGVVSKEYKLITNEEAIKLGQKCCQELLGLEKADVLEVFNVSAPSTLSYCYIDLVHKGFEMNLWDGSSEADIYLPYVRVTNSYNTCRALRFDIGFCRKICLNGTIFEAETIRFVYSHVKHKIGRSIRFDIEKDKLETLIIEFKDAMRALKDFQMEKVNGKQIFYIVLRMPDERKVINKETDSQEFYSLSTHVERLFEKYYGEMGDNAYSLFNIITDMASNPPENRFFRKDINAMQRTAGAWVSDFRKLLKDSRGEFQWEKYIEDLRQKYGNRSGENPYN